MFKNREEAGRILAEKLKEDMSGQAGEPKALKKLMDEVVVLGIPRGGVVVAKEVAKILNCPLDVIVVKKIGAPGNPELAIGAIGETEGSKYIDQRLIVNVGAEKEYLKSQILKLRAEIKRREKLFRQRRPPLNLKNKIVIIVDDGAATGATVIAACREVWNNQPKKVIIALPVLSKDTLKKLEDEADEVIFLETPWPFFAVGQFYQNFPQVSDETVVKILSKQ